MTTSIQGETVSLLELGQSPKYDRPGPSWRERGGVYGLSKTGCGREEKKAEVPKKLTDQEEVCCARTG